MMMKLNVGASVARGIYKQKEWINLDLFKMRGVNVRGDMESLPFFSESFSEIHCIHVLEHLTRDKHMPVLHEMHRVLGCDGHVYVEVPDFERTIAKLFKAYNEDDAHAIHIWRTSIYGKTERPGMAHHFGFDEETLKRYMKEAGFSNVHRLSRPHDMISDHWRQEPVLLMKGVKR